MLSDKKIEQALKNGEIEITVSFERKNEKTSMFKEEKAILQSNAFGNIYSDRLKLSMGPIIKVLRRKSVPSKYRFKNYKHYYDLRKSSDKFLIAPGESIVFLTNERVKLNGKYACLIVPRISLSDVGIVVSTAYVDPYYDGLLRLHLSNFSDNSYELKSLEPIAQCFFFELSDAASSKFKDQFPTKSVFFGQTWQEIIRSDRDPFPTKKEAAPIDKLSALKYDLSIIREFIKKHSLLSVFVTNILMAVSMFCGVRENLLRYADSVNQMVENFRLESTEIVIEAGERYGQKELWIECEKSEIITVLCNNDKVQYDILSGETEDRTRIIFYLQLQNEIQEKTKIDFSYAIIRSVRAENGKSNG